MDYLLCFTIFLAGILRYQTAHELLPKHHILYFTGINKNVKIKGYVAGFPAKNDYGVSCEIYTEQIQISDSFFTNTCGKILLKWSQPTFKLKKGEILAGQTLTELNHSEIVEYSMAIVNGASSLGKVLDKGKISEIDIDLANGFAVVINSGDIALTALAGQDARAELGLVRLNLKTALENISNLLK